jgi:transposase
VRLGSHAQGSSSLRRRCRARCGERAGRSKKSLIASERDEAARAAWREVIIALDPADLLFVDETSTHTALTRRRARAPRGQRAVGAVPRNHGPNITLLAALTPTGIGPALTMAGSVTGAALTAYAQRVLAPSLRPGQVVVLDNLSAHKAEAARLAVEAVRARLLFLPADSPDFNPIELAFAKITQHLRAAGQRTQEGLLTATTRAIDAISQADAHGFYAHYGFSLSAN